jgi:hypothetical protein
MQTRRTQHICNPEALIHMHMQTRRTQSQALQMNMQLGPTSLLLLFFLGTRPTFLLIRPALTAGGHVYSPAPQCARWLLTRRLFFILLGDALLRPCYADRYSFCYNRGSLTPLRATRKHQECFQALASQFVLVGQRSLRGSLIPRA